MEQPARRERAVPPELPEGEVALPKRRDSEEHDLVSPEHQRGGRGGSSSTFWEEDYASSEISVCGYKLGIGIGEDGMRILADEVSTPTVAC